MHPLKYKPEFCDDVVEFMGKGFSLEAFAGHVRVARQTVYDWREKYPEFKAACNMGQAARQAFFEDKGINGMHNKNFNGKVWSLFMSQLDWTQKQHITHEGGGMPVQVYTPDNKRDKTDKPSS